MITGCVPEPCGQLLVNAIKSAIGEDRHHVAGFELRRDFVDDGIHIGRSTLGFQPHSAPGRPLPGSAAPPRNALLLKDSGQDDAVGPAAGSQSDRIPAPCAAACSSAAPNGPQAGVGINRTQRPEGFADGRGVVREVFDHRDASDLGAHLQPPLHALETCSAATMPPCRFPAPWPGPPPRSHSAHCARRRGSSRVQPTTRPRANLPAREAVFVPQILNAQSEVSKSRSARRGRERPQRSRLRWAAVEGDDQPPPRNQVTSRLKPSSPRQVRVNVGVVKLDVGQNQRVGK